MEIDMKDIESLVSRLRALARHEHSDFSIGDEDANIIVQLANDVNLLEVEIEAIEDEVFQCQSEIEALEDQLFQCHSDMGNYE